MIRQHDPNWDTYSPAYCPFAGEDCRNGCPSNDKRICIDDQMIADIDAADEDD